MTAESLPRLYLAAPLFSAAERAFNARVEKIVRPFFNVFMPQRDGSVFSELVKHGVDPSYAAKSVFDRDMRELKSSSVIFAILDGRVIDEGVAFELGVAHTLEIPCITLQTDPRRLQPAGNNPMISGAISMELYTMQEVKLWATKFRRTQK